MVDPAEASPPPSSPEPPPAATGGGGLDLQDKSWVPEDRPALKDALETLYRHRSQQEPGAARGRIPSNLFEDIEGHQEVKRVLWLALDAPKPTHVILVGPPGTAKTEFLLAMGRLWGSRYATGASISQAGLVQFLLQYPQAQRLLIDDLDKADQADLWGLLELMQSGSLTRLQHERQEHVKREGLTVFSAANSVDKLPEPLLSRFVRLDIPAYTEDQFRAVATTVLQRKEGLSAQRAAAIAQAVGTRSTDLRAAVQVGRLAGPENDVQPILDQVIPAGRR
jgi:Holliday junction DNA helicase RuvB